MLFLFFFFLFRSLCCYERKLCLSHWRNRLRIAYHVMTYAHLKFRVCVWSFSTLRVINRKSTASTNSRLDPRRLDFLKKLSGIQKAHVRDYWLLFRLRNLLIIRNNNVRLQKNTVFTRSLKKSIILYYIRFPVKRIVLENKQKDSLPESKMIFDSNSSINLNSTCFFFKSQIVN